MKYSKGKSDGKKGCGKMQMPSKKDHKVVAHKMEPKRVKSRIKKHLKTHELNAMLEK